MTKKTKAIRHAKNSAGQTEIYLYDEISCFSGITAIDFISLLRSHPGPVTLRINSPGGDVVEGLAIYNAIKRHGNVAIEIDGLAASIASYIATAGASVGIAGNGLLMIHNPSTIACGEADEMRETAAVLDTIRDIIANGYAAKTGKPVSDIVAMMDAETTLNALDAIALGFCDHICGEDVAPISPAEPMQEEINIDTGDDGMSPDQIAVLQDQVKLNFANLQKAQEEATANAEALATAQAEVASLKAELAAQAERVNAEAVRVVASAGQPAINLAATESAANAPAQTLREKYAELRATGDSSKWLPFLNAHRAELIS